MTALEPALLPLIEGIIDLVNWFSQLPEPIKEVAGLFIVGGMFAGAILYTVGTIASFALNTIPQLTMALTGAGGAATAIESASSMMATGLPAAAATGASSLALAFAIAATAILISLAVIWSGWDHFSTALQLQSKLNTEALSGDWENYKQNIQIQDNEIYNGILFGLARIGEGIYVAIEEWIRIWDRFYKFIGLMSADQYTKVIKESYDRQTAYHQKFVEGEKGIYLDQIKEMINVGVSVDNLIDAYKKEPLQLAIIRDAIIELDKQQEYSIQLKQINTYLTNTQTTAAMASSLAIDGQTKSLIDFNAEMQKSIDLSARAAAAGFQGTYTFGGGAAAGYANTTFTAEQLYSKMTADIAARAPKAGDFIWRAGEGVTQISPNDTVIGTQGGNLGGTTVGDIIVNVTTGPVSNDIDVKDLANRVSDEIMKDIRNYTKYVPTW
jgi:hypothetical protein